MCTAHDCLRKPDISAFLGRVTQLTYHTKVRELAADEDSGHTSSSIGANMVHTYV